jgi:hypothetical protein
MSRGERQARKRTRVSPRTFEFIRSLRLLFRYSPGRDACVLRFVGNRFGPVLQKKD